MKKGIALLLFFFMLLPVFPASAEIELTTLDLPSDFQNADLWPYTYKNSCYIYGNLLESAAYARIDRTTRKIELIREATLNKKVYKYVHSKAEVVGSWSNAEFYYHYYPVGNGWLKLNVLNPEDLYTSNALFRGHLGSIGADAIYMTAYCRVMIEGLQSFYQNLSKEAEKE